MCTPVVSVNWARRPWSGDLGLANCVPEHHGRRSGESVGLDGRHLLNLNELIPGWVGFLIWHDAWFTVIIHSEFGFTPSLGCAQFADGARGAESQFSLYQSEILALPVMRRIPRRIRFRPKVVLSKNSYIVTSKCAHLVNCSIRFQCKLKSPQTWDHFQVLFEVLFPGESLCSNGLARVFAVPCLLAFCCSWLLLRSPPPCGRRKRP